MESKLEIVAGPNGSGKSTFAESYLKNTNQSSTYLNPDLIAAGMSLQSNDLVSMQAGRILIQETRNLLEKNESFSFESTLSGKNWLHLIKAAKKRNYKVVIYFIFLKSVELNLKRIKKRVMLGGHDIPTAAVKRRVPRSFQNFWDLYRPLCDQWFVFDNSLSRPKIVMSSAQFNKMKSIDQKEFEKSFLTQSNPQKNGKLRR